MPNPLPADDASNAAASRESTVVEPPKGALLVIFAIVAIDLMGFGIIIPLLPFYEKNPQDNPFAVTMLFSVFSICQFIGSPILGAWSDRVGRKPVLALSQFGSAAGYVLLGLATQFNFVPATVLLLVYISRVIDGFTGGNISTAQAYISDVTTAQNRAKGMGLLGAAFGIGFALGPCLGGVLGHYSVSLPAYVAAGFSMLAGIFTLTHLPESHVHKPTEAEQWLHPSRFAPVFRNRVLSQLLLISFCLMAAFVMMESTIGLFLNHLFGWHQREVGLYFGYIGVLIAIVQGGLIGRLVKRLGDWPLAIAGPILVMVGMLGYIWVGYHALGALAVLMIGGAINATGRSLQMPTINSLVSKFSARDQQGVVFGLSSGMSSLARVIGPIIAGFSYPWLKHTGPYVTAAVITLAMGIWLAALRQAVPEEKPLETPGVDAASEAW